jgi:hypothetical protein
VRYSVPWEVSMWRLVSLVLLAGCADAPAQQLPERIAQPLPVGRAIDSTHRVVCYVFPNGSGDCEKF